jgi:hypothetical protein
MYVYFAAVGGLIKVGYSENPERRVRNLFRGSTLYGAPVDAYEARGTQVMLRTIEGCKTVERRCHEALADFEVSLEWFLDEPPVRAFIDAAEDWREDYPRVVREGGPVEPDWRPNGAALGLIELRRRSA